VGRREISRSPVRRHNHDSQRRLLTYKSLPCHLQLFLLASPAFLVCVSLFHHLLQFLRASSVIAMILGPFLLNCFLQWLAQSGTSLTFQKMPPTWPWGATISESFDMVASSLVGGVKMQPTGNGENPPSASCRLFDGFPGHPPISK
jgi:hypothetical protein